MKKEEFLNNLYRVKQSHYPRKVMIQSVQIIDDIAPVSCFKSSAYYYKEEN
jgi:hypothetical protein